MSLVTNPSEITFTVNFAFRLLIIGGDSTKCLKALTYSESCGDCSCPDAQATMEPAASRSWAHVQPLLPILRLESWVFTGQLGYATIMNPSGWNSTLLAYPTGPALVRHGQGYRIR